MTRIGLGAQFAGALCANAEWYESLPDAVRAALHTGADRAREWYLSALETAVERAFAGMAENGAVIADAPGEMRAQWAAGMDNAAREWAERLDARGQPGSEVLELYMSAMRAAGATPLRDWDRK